MKVFFIAVFSVFLLPFLFFCIKSHKFFKMVVFNAFIGLSLLAIINLTSKFTGLYIPINWYSVGGISVFSVPAICLILVAQILI